VWSTSTVLTAWSLRGQFRCGDEQVSSQEERVARNESTTRQINEQIEQAHQAASPEGYVRVLCECGREDCDRLIAMTLAEYESLRADPRQFAVTRGHVLADVEQVVAATDRYAVVAKREGTRRRSRSRRTRAASRRAGAAAVAARTSTRWRWCPSGW